MKIEKLLIANRGEIAHRIMRTAVSMGYPIVAVYSDRDKSSALVKEADESVYLPGNTIAETYLNIEAIIKAAKDTGANAIHPGYGFLSENPLFAEACEKENIIFVGPSADAIRSMGNKIAAREIAIKHDVPIAPGITGSPEYLLSNYKKVGLPILVKAAAGGGGKGMRIVRSENEIESALRSTSSEALNYFGDGTIYIERFFDNPRHIEVQILGDKHGNMIHLFERECSVQRRHQKIIEEAPSPTLTNEVRQKICNAAVRMASSINYHGAGTIEFLVDKDLRFYFLEMNTRIQVEHPVTEMITGVDIVKEQFRIAEGEKLFYEQNDIKIIGHAIELRIYAEDPENNFMPSPGRILKYCYPGYDIVTGRLRHESVRKVQIRIDDPCLKDNSQIFPDYDPLISKIIASGKDRDEAVKKLISFLPDYLVMGIKTNLNFLQLLLGHPDYNSNKVHTGYIDENYPDLKKFVEDARNHINNEIPLIAALIYSLIQETEYDELSIVSASDVISPTVYKEIGFWRINKRISLMLNNELHQIKLNSFNKLKTIPVPLLKSFDDEAQMNTFSLLYSKNGKQNTALLVRSFINSIKGEKKTGNKFTIIHEGEKYEIYMIKSPSGKILIKFLGYDFTFERSDAGIPDNICFDSVVSHRTDSGDIISPMPGKVLTVMVKEGDKVKKGDLLMVIEAMKMENNILAPSNGVIDKVLAKEGETVDNSSHLIHLTAEVQE